MSKLRLAKSGAVLAQFEILARENFSFHSYEIDVTVFKNMEKVARAQLFNSRLALARG